MSIGKIRLGRDGKTRERKKVKMKRSAVACGNTNMYVYNELRRINSFLNKKNNVIITPILNKNNGIITPALTFPLPC